MKAAVFLLVAVALFGCAANRSGLRCRDECKVVTHKGEVIQGRLLVNDGDSLIVGDSLTVGPESRGARLSDNTKSTRTIALKDVRVLYRVKRSDTIGLLLGGIAGSVVAVALSMDSITECENGGFGCIDERINNGVAAGVGGFLVGAILGGVAGHSAQAFDEVPLEALPCCGP